MSRCGCPGEDERQSQHSRDTVQDDEPIVLATETTDLTLEIFSNSKLKSGTFSVCRAAHCTFDEMIKAVVGSEPSEKFKGYMWALTREIRSILAKRNTARDKTPRLTPKNVGAFCVIDDGEPDYKSHALLGYSRPTDNFWMLHESVAARGDLLIVFQARGVIQHSSTPPFLVRAEVGNEPAP
jgi:hypothetical protein